MYRNVAVAISCFLLVLCLSVSVAQTAYNSSLEFSGKWDRLLISSDDTNWYEVTGNRVVFEMQEGSVGEYSVLWRYNGLWYKTKVRVTYGTNKHELDTRTPIAHNFGIDVDKLREHIDKCCAEYGDSVITLVINNESTLVPIHEVEKILSKHFTHYFVLYVTDDVVKQAISIVSKLENKYNSYVFAIVPKSHWSATNMSEQHKYLLRVYNKSGGQFVVEVGGDDIEKIVEYGDGKLKNKQPNNSEIDMSTILWIAIIILVVYWILKKQN